MFTFTYHVTEEDYLTFNENHIKNTPAGKKALFALRMLLPILVLFALFIFFVAEADIELIIIEAIVLSLACIFWFIFAEKFFMSSARKKLKKQKGNQMLFSPTGTLAFDEEKIVEITDRIEIKTPYSTIEKVYVADTAFYFYIGPIQAHILPYHNFDGEDQRNAFLSWLKTALGESKIVLVKK